MSQNKTSVIFLKDWSILIQSLPSEKQLVFWSLFMQYHSDLECDDENVKPIWNFIKAQLINMDNKYQENIVNRNKTNGLKGGRPKTQDNLNNPMGLLGTQITLNENVNVNKKDNEKKIFIPPVLSDVQSYFQENGYSLESANKAFNYYATNNWADSKNNKIKNWKQKMVGVWFKEENKAKINNTKNIEKTYGKW
jgi:hypothetical protein